MTAKQCGAKTRSGGSCKRPPMDNGRCNLHGGHSTGAPAGNDNAVTHGFYRDALTPEEQVMWDELELGSVDDELRLMRIRLARVLAAETAAKGEPELAEVSNNNGASEYVARESRKSVVRDYQAIIDRTIARIESLEIKRMHLLSNLKGDGADDIGRQDTFISPDEEGPDKPIL